MREAGGRPPRRGVGLANGVSAADGSGATAGGSGSGSTAADCDASWYVARATRTISPPREHRLDGVPRRVASVVVEAVQIDEIEHPRRTVRERGEDRTLRVEAVRSARAVAMQVDLAIETVADVLAQLP